MAGPSVYTWEQQAVLHSSIETARRKIHSSHQYGTLAWHGWGEVAAQSFQALSHRLKISQILYCTYFLPGKTWLCKKKNAITTTKWRHRQCSIKPTYTVLYFVVNSYMGGWGTYMAPETWSKNISQYSANPHKMYYYYCFHRITLFSIVFYQNVSTYVCTWRSFCGSRTARANTTPQPSPSLFPHHFGLLTSGKWQTFKKCQNPEILWNLELLTFQNSILKCKMSRFSG